MQIAWHTFTPGWSLIGGLLIGLAAAVLLLFNGRIAGVSGIVAGLLTPRHPDTAWRGLFVLGLVAAPLLYGAVSALPASQIEASYPQIILAGLLVGLGTRYGAGCTSGHGVCGLSRFSLRSAMATFCFMMAGFASVYVLRHLLGL
ncbi:YeeE/YedE family protein [Herbaspirillum rubrisubalbicans]|uniref:YeeE/YedE n=2 Tax=Herbaspirillum rubrisubalbicans TaxID=80842 RepID=A0ABX9C7Q2_9BURK|nr:YeeE/YedE family protein [Herbaspirillum rubrisubalbicans]QJQ01297.1 YeeE/YedE [Herbaspirillum rubrisubalbicans Os34]RAM66968.1 YeeE/YedE [Herbaspirillum rubrisubalbicans]